MEFCFQQECDADAIKVAHVIAQALSELNCNADYVEFGPPGNLRFMVFADGGVSEKKTKTKKKS